METANLITVMKNYKITNTESYESIKLGIDAHAKWYYVARQLDGATPQPVQKMDFEGLLHFVARQKRMAISPLQAPLGGHSGRWPPLGGARSILNFELPIPPKKTVLQTDRLPPCRPRTGVPS